MKIVNNIPFGPDGQEVFEKIIAIWPPIIRDRKKEKIIYILSLLMQTRKLKTVDKNLVIEATRLVVPKSYDPIFHMIEDMDMFVKKMLDPFKDIKAYNKIPVQVKRWQRPPRKKTATSTTQKQVIAFCASPRKNGNTDLLIEEALKGAEAAGAQTEKIMLNRINMEYCIGCRKCKEPGFEQIYIIKDDMTEIYRKIIDARGIIVGFPIYTGRECAQLSTFLDRWDGFERYLLQGCLKPGRIAMVIGTWGYPYSDTYDHVIENIISVLHLHKVETVEALSACGFEGILHGLGPNRRGVLAQHPRQLKKAYEAGKAFVECM